MKTFQEILRGLIYDKFSESLGISKNELAIKLIKGEISISESDLSGLASDDIDLKAIKLYAKQVAEDVRRRCAENATCFVPWEGQDAVIAESSILETEIILP